MSANTISATDADFAQIIGSEKPVLVDFWAEWCGPCRMVAPVLEEIADEFPEKISIAKLNIDENPQSAADNGVMSIPTMVVYQNGEERKRIVGARPKHSMLQELAEFLN